MSRAFEKFLNFNRRYGRGITGASHVQTYDEAEARATIALGSMVREPGYTVKATNFFVQAANARAAMLALLKRISCECGEIPRDHDNCPLD